MSNPGGPQETPGWKSKTLVLGRLPILHSSDESWGPGSQILCCLEPRISVFHLTVPSIADNTWHRKDVGEDGMSFLVRLSLRIFQPSLWGSPLWSKALLISWWRWSEKCWEEPVGCCDPQQLLLPNHSFPMVWTSVFVNQSFHFGTRNSMRQKIRTRPQFGKARWFLDLVWSNQRAPATGKMGFLPQSYIITLFFLFARRQAFWTQNCLFAAGHYLRL